MTSARRCLIKYLGWGLFVVRTSTSGSADDTRYAALSLGKFGYYKHFLEEVYQSLVLDRRELRNGN